LDHPEAKTDRVQAVAAAILDAFREGRIPAALSLLFIRRRSNVPSALWSWRNRLLAALHGYGDARGFRQWKQVGRHVRQGQKAFYILGPRMVPNRHRPGDPEEEDRVMVGVVGIPVFGYEQTEGAPLADDPEAAADAAFLAALPFAEVARAWGLTLSAYPPDGTGKAGFFSPDRAAIGLGVRNLSTWAHELIHAADHQRNPLLPGQHLDQEVVAQFGASVLLECVGEHQESDLGRSWSYINEVCASTQSDPLATIDLFLERVIAAVSLVLDTAEALQAAHLPAEP